MLRVIHVPVFNYNNSDGFILAVVKPVSTALVCAPLQADKANTLATPNIARRNVVFMRHSSHGKLYHQLAYHSQHTKQNKRPVRLQAAYKVLTRQH